MRTLSLCMIVKNGEKYIEQCISSVMQAVNEVIVVDTGSTDHTIECIKRFNPKIYEYPWNNDFAAARNFALKQATSDYILMLDADEVMYQQDVPKLIKHIQKTKADGISIKFHNLTNELSLDEYNTHIGLRILKKGCFHYEGVIHEQPIFHKKGKKPVLEVSEIRVRHYGYLPCNAGLKKHNRNMPMLKQLLEKEPNNAFHLFNLGNEYMNINDYPNALACYEKSKQYKDVKMAYVPHLMYRLATCLHKMRRTEESLDVITEGLQYYPACTDLEYLRGDLLMKMKRFTLALDSFNRCIEMGAAPQTLSFFDEVEDFRPLVKMAEIYSFMEDYQKSLDCYMKALRVKPHKSYLLYKVAASLNHIFADKNTVYQNLCSMFADKKYLPNLLVTADALLDEKLFEQADKILEQFSEDLQKTNADVLFLKARQQFYKGNYQDSFKMFLKCIDSTIERGILPMESRRSHDYMTACSLICTELKPKFMGCVRALKEGMDKIVYAAFLETPKESLAREAFPRIKAILSKLLMVREYDVFEKALQIFNVVDDNECLLYLADIYYENGFHDMAFKTILRSVKELDAINSNAVNILNKEFCIS